MTGDDRLQLIHVKLERARQHIAELRSEVQAFLDARPYEVSAKRDPESHRPIYYVSSVRPVPKAVAAITGDVLQNLRSALDHLAYQLVLVSSNQPSNQTSFPIFDDAVKYKTSRGLKVKGMRPDAVEAIDALKPFKGGNDALWRLHRLSNVDKHRLLIAVGSAYRSVNVTSTIDRLIRQMWPGEAKPSFSPLFLRPADPLFPLKPGDELFGDAADAEITNIQFRFDVVLNEPEVIEAAPVLQCVDEMAELVTKLIESFRPYLD